MISCLAPVVATAGEAASRPVCVRAVAVIGNLAGVTGTDAH